MISIYRVTSWLYPLVPLLAALLATLAMRKRKSAAPLRAYLRIGALGTGLGIALVLLYAIGFGGRISAWQAAVACWSVTAALCIVQGFNLAVESVLAVIFRLRSSSGGPCCAAAGVAATVLRAMAVFLAGGAYLSGWTFVPAPDDSNRYAAHTAGSTV